MWAAERKLIVMYLSLQDIRPPPKLHPVAHLGVASLKTGTWSGTPDSFHNPHRNSCQWLLGSQLLPGTSQLLVGGTDGEATENSAFLGLQPYLASL